MNENLLIGIGGVSNAGKSELALRIKNHFGDHKVKVLCQDDFVLPMEEIPKINGHIDWEIPISVDYQQFRNEVVQSFKENDIVISEGLFGFYDPELNKMMDIKLFMFLDYSDFYNRKKTDFRWGIEPDWYIKHIYNSFMEFSLKYPEDAHFIDASRTIDFRAIEDLILDVICVSNENR